MSIGMCTNERWSTDFDVFDVTNLIWINGNEYFPFLMRAKKKKRNCERLEKKTHEVNGRERGDIRLSSIAREIQRRCYSHVNESE